jgi:hypothetical protein
MTKRDHRADRRAAAQLPMAFTTRQVLDQKRRADAVVLLSKLLLHVARAGGRSEVVDDPS